MSAVNSTSAYSKNREWEEIRTPAIDRRRQGFYRIITDEVPL